ncbi:MAG: division/cell wall cluster transcriptional repressor MraZ [Mogibacterium sp.]|nr:division/cell wall cluster transcriptional repressor MraZ [Mogibacterium sp.]
MFTGTFENSIDDRNRMIIPAKYRDAFKGGCVLARGFDKCLYIYTQEDWDILVGKFSRLSQVDKEMRRFIREFFSNAEECIPDKQNRIVIPQNLKKYAGLEKDLVTMGVMDKVEVWSKEVLNDPEGENMLDNDAFVAKLAQYDI